VGKAVCQFLILEALFEATAAIPDDHIYIVGGDVTAAHIAVIVVFSIKRAHDLVLHGPLGA
jgi:hypothetical protein